MDGTALAHCATAECAVPAERALAFLADGEALGRWALGCWRTEPRGGGLFVGRSLFDGAPAWVRLAADPARLAVEYFVGPAPDALVPRIAARVVPGPVLGRSAGTCLVSLIAWREAAMDDARWQRLVACHGVEVLLIKACLEGGASP